MIWNLIQQIKDQRMITCFRCRQQIRIGCFDAVLQKIVNQDRIIAAQLVGEALYGNSICIIRVITEIKPVAEHEG